MAKSKNDSKKPSDTLAQHPLVDKLLSDPGQPSQFAVLTGWLGRSDQDGKWRLYVSPTLNEYVEFSSEDVCHHAPLDQQSVLARTLIWLKATAEIVWVQSTPAATQREYLQGDITRSLLPRIGFPIIGGTVTNTLVGWSPNTWNCQNRSAGTCTLVLCTRVNECLISREANPCV
jgi:hypothetical protein